MDVPSRFLRAGAQTLFLGLFGFSVHAAPEDCAENGGQATCTAPISVPTPWVYALCDDFPAYTYRAAIWCRVMGGTWTGAGCAGSSPPDESTIYSQAETFERTVHNTQNCDFQGTDGGWLSPGQTINSWNCWSGGPMFQNGIETFNLREMSFSGQYSVPITNTCTGSWNERAIALRVRGVQTGCPEGYALRTSRFTGQQECFRVSACPVAPLPPYSPDPYPLDTDNLTKQMKTALQCMLDNDTTARPTSAYRPPAYNQHLIDVWKKWMKELRDETNPACQAFRAEVQAHFNRHELLESQEPSPTSAHTRGEAFDMTSRLSSTNLDAQAKRCELYRPIPISDPVHFIHR